MQNRSGKTVRNLTGEEAYESFMPAPLPPSPDILIDDEMRELLIDAHTKLALLKTVSDQIPSHELFISMYVRKEALVSSKIEGTQCTLEDVLNPAIDENKNADVSDVVNYVRAVFFAIDAMKSLPLCNRLLRQTHEVLMQSVRGCERAPGEFRTTQNWIGNSNSNLKNAFYIPPNPMDMTEAMSELEKYMNAEDGTDPLVKAALIHYQFETIHPFLDGNGRVGRLLITLYLMKAEILTSPILYLSCYLKSNQIEYYDRMREVRRKGNYEQWVNFFLRGIVDTARDAMKTVQKLSALHNQNEAVIKQAPARSKANLSALFSYIEKHPIIDVAATADALSLSRNGTAKYIALFCEKGILSATGKKGKAVVYSYEEYLKILRKDTD